MPFGAVPPGLRAPILPAMYPDAQSRLRRASTMAGIRQPEGHSVFSPDSGAILSGCGSRRAVIARFPLALIIAACVSSCSALVPGANFPKTVSVALAHPEETGLGRQFESAATEHGGNSGFRIITLGVDGFLTRMQMIGAAERTLDLQYFIFRGDETGRLLTSSLLHAAARGVRVRVLIDDGDTIAGDEQINALHAYPGVQIRVFNPFSYRGHNKMLRAVEFLFNASRLDYRMHNKLLVVDNAAALIGGRNVGNQYFQVDPESQFADDDVFVAGPLAGKLSATFDEYWNSGLAIPAEALVAGDGAHPRPGRQASAEKQLQRLQSGGVDYLARIASGEPYAGMISGRLPLVWRISYRWRKNGSCCKVCVNERFACVS